jgi:hypothetical protein
MSRILRSNGAGNLTRNAAGRRDYANNHEQGFGRSDIANGHERGRIANNNAAVLQSNEGDEKPNAAGDGRFEIARDGFQYLLANAGHRQQKKENAAIEVERCRPRNLFLETA